MIISSVSSAVKRTRTSQTGVSETSPLLLPLAAATTTNTSASATSSILLEIIGARHLPHQTTTSKTTTAQSSSSSFQYYYCVINYGTKTLHRTLPVQQTRTTRTPFQSNNSKTQPVVWTIQHHALCILFISINDLQNHKPLQVHVWAIPPPRVAAAVYAKPYHPYLIGSVRLTANEILQRAIQSSSSVSATASRWEMPLRDHLDRPVELPQQQELQQRQPALLALRVRVATAADVQFVTEWNKNVPHTTITRTIPKLPSSYYYYQQHASESSSRLLITERPESQVPGASITQTALTLRSKKIKPYPNPYQPNQQPSSSGIQKQPRNRLNKQQLRQTSLKPSIQWIHTGSTSSNNSLGKVYLEILSCKDLPNVDYGVGNETDAFCTAIYGDAMVQTDIIDDELDPVWLPWTQRAFCFELQQHPSSVLYIAVFGFKRALLPHKPIGRIEIYPLQQRFQHATVYTLEYPLALQSHTSLEHRVWNRGSIQVRLRVERTPNNERACLMAAAAASAFWIPPPPVYVNVKTKKSLRVARYTACGEMDNDEKFNLRILQAMVDEILEVHLRKLVYALSDATWSLVWWRSQVFLFGPSRIGLPLYSLLAFVLGIYLIERPAMFPAIVCLAAAAVMLANMQQRLRNPSPWRQCFSFGYYLRILVCGKSKRLYDEIVEEQGWQEMKEQDDALRRRIENDRIFFEKKEAAEKEIEEIENERVETKSRAILPLEIMLLLGKVQGIVGGICRLLRSFDAILTWEESDLSFWATLVFLVSGVALLFIPCAFLFRWSGRILVVLFLGPQNKIIDLLYVRQRSSDENRIRKLLANRMFNARCMQEEAAKLRAFRHVVFGKFSTMIPSSQWTPHRDCPMPSSTARVTAEPPTDKSSIPNALGQQLWGLMIPRPKDEWIANSEEERKLIQKTKVLVSTIEEDKCDTKEASNGHLSDDAGIFDEGVEVEHLFDEETGLLHGAVPSPEMPHESYVRDESLQELGVEVLEDDENGTRFVQALRGSVHDFADLPTYSEYKGTMSDDEDESEKEDEEIGIQRDWGAPAENVTTDPNNSFSLPGRGHQRGSAMEPGFEIIGEMDSDLVQVARRSSANLPADTEEHTRRPPDRNSASELGGLEITEQFDAEAQFVQKTWRSTSLEEEDLEGQHRPKDAASTSTSVRRASASEDLGFEVLGHPTFN